MFGAWETILQEFTISFSSSENSVIYSKRFGYVHTCIGNKNWLQHWLIIISCRWQISFDIDCKINLYFRSIKLQKAYFNQGNRTLKQRWPYYFLGRWLACPCIVSDYHSAMSDPYEGVCMYVSGWLLLHIPFRFQNYTSQE